MYISLADIKRHLNIDANYSGDDEYLTDLIEVSEEAVATHIDRPLLELENEEGKIPHPIRHAIRFLVGQLYANREPVAFSAAMEVPYTYGYLISLYRRYSIPS